MVWGIRLVIMYEALREVTGMSEALYKYLLNKKETKKKKLVVKLGSARLYKQTLSFELVSFEKFVMVIDSLQSKEEGRA